MRVARQVLYRCACSHSHLHISSLTDISVTVKEKVNMLRSCWEKQEARESEGRRKGRSEGRRQRRGNKLQSR
jgi:hypothetical protein